MGSMWVRGERRCWSGRARSRGRPRRRRRGAGASDALGAFEGALTAAVAPTRPRGPRRPVYGKERRWDGYGGGGRGPGTPFDAAVDLDVVWSPGVPPAGS